MKCYSNVIELRAEKLDEHKRLHANVWPAVISSVLPSPAILALNPVTSQIALGHSLGTFG